MAGIRQSDEMLRDAVNSILPASDNLESVEQGNGFRIETTPVFYQEYQAPESSSYNESTKEIDGTPPQPQSSSPAHTSSSVNSSETNSELYGKKCDVVAAHYNNVPEKGLHERDKSRIVYLRNFNNWIKSMLIDEYLVDIKEQLRHGSKIKVLDVGCGKGGDLFKWRKGGVSYVICADLAATSIEQCKERYEEMKKRSLRERHRDPVFDAEFIVANCTKERLRSKYNDSSISFDLVSCQFAFHYCFESLPQAECMLQNVSECLKPGGYFIGTCPNANAIVSQIRKGNGKKMGNSVFSVEFDNELTDTPPLFGCEYNFHMEGVVDCPEFLVHFPTFIRLAEKFSLKLVACETFPSYYQRKHEEGRALLGRMQALETYPPFPGQNTVASLSEYDHADNFIKTENSARNIGTLSKSEWEAASLYLIFAFRKVQKSK